MADFQEDFLTKIVGVSWPQGGLVVVEADHRLITNTTPGDTTFVDNWSLGLTSNASVAGQLRNPLGKEYKPPTVSAVMSAATTWAWTTYRKNNDFTGGAGSYTLIDRALYTVITDKGELTTYGGSVSSGSVPFIIDFTGGVRDANASPPILDGLTKIPMSDGHGGVVYRTEVDAFMTYLYTYGIVPGASVYVPLLQTIIASHTVAGASVATYDRTINTVNFININKVKPRLRGAALRLTVAVPSIRWIQDAAWSVRVSTWKKNKVFPVDGYNVLLDVSGAVDTNRRFSLGNGELDTPARYLTYDINTKTLKIVAS